MTYIGINAIYLSKEILGVILNLIKGFPASLHVPSRARMIFHAWATIGYLDLLWALSNGEFAQGKVIVICRSFSFAYPFLASLKMSGTTITYSGYCHPPRQFHHNSSPKSPLCAYPLQKGSKFFKIFLWKYSIQEGYGVIFSKKMKIKRSTRDPNPKIVQKRSSIKWPKNIYKTVSPFLPLSWTFVIP